MACACGKNRAKREKYQVVLPGGMKVSKTSEAAAKAFAIKHPGSKVVKQS
jgi:hypothetical protein